MRKLLLLVLGSVMGSLAIAQVRTTPNTKYNYGPYIFTDDYVAPCTLPVGQGITGTCWCFGGVGTIEAEAKRMGKGEFDLSEMWVCRQAFVEKARWNIRKQRPTAKGSGGLSDAFFIVDKYGIVPEEVYQGMNYGVTTMHVHGELNAVVNSYIKAIGKSPDGKISDKWEEGLNSILDAYLGPAPTEFTYKGKSYTPKSFADMLGFKRENYVLLTSFNHHPFWTTFPLEISGNWRDDHHYNLPLDDFIYTIEECIKAGYTLTLLSDVTNPGYCKPMNICVYPVTSVDEIPEPERVEWIGYTDGMLQELGNRDKTGSFSRPVVEKKVTQESRQVGYDELTTRQDHVMHIVGIAHDQRGHKFFKIRNSAHGNGVYQNGAFYYCSEEYMRNFTLGVMVNKNGIPDNIASKLGIEKSN